MANKSIKCSVKGSALGAGIVWGAGMLGLGILGMAAPGYAANFIAAMGSIYPGFAATPIGSVIGGILGLIDGAAAGAIFAYIYNRFSD
ncbi:MAG: hypothetical protein KGH65_03875 [Candidatus Micrarchaeota archaeon]|nr:hypothetical protein [Candidatus Micrarchaeota archaeon]